MLFSIYLNTDIFKIMSFTILSIVSIDSSIVGIMFPYN